MSRRLLVWLCFVLAGWSNLAAQTPDATPQTDNPTGNAGALKAQIGTGGSYDAHSGNATRVVNDLHVPGALGVYGLDFTRYWNSIHNDYDDAEIHRPLDFGASGWSHSWRWEASLEFKYPDEVRDSDFDTNQYTTAINITFPDGHTTQFKIVRLKIGWWMVGGSYPWWGPPYTDSEKQDFANGGVGVHDHICNMSTDGSEFWICRADGGSVHFIDMQAREVYDPNGLKTTLSYDSLGHLYHVEQPGGRFLELTWQPFAGGSYMITRVQSQSGQAVTYNYLEAQGTGGAIALHQAIYQSEDVPNGAPGQKVTADYHYGNCWGDEPVSGVCSGADASSDPLLKRADDPHYAGAMTIIRYNYRAWGCPPIEGNPLAYPDHVAAQPFAIAAEKSDNGVAVSTFQINCDDGLRTENDGLGDSRQFFFGTAAETAQSIPGGALFCRSYQLGKLTDFWRVGEPAPPDERQNFDESGAPRRMWDGLGNMTEAIVASGDDSGEPAEIHRVGAQPGEPGSVDYYDRVNPGASAAINPALGMHNPYNHWLFSETHQLNNATSHTTIYMRDSRRRVTHINYPNNSAEDFTYNDFNQVTSHTLASGAIVTYEYDPTTHHLLKEYNSIDGQDARKEYIYDDPAHPDLPHKIIDARARSSAAPYSVRMEYDGANRVVEIHYAPTPGVTDPYVGYGYDVYGNCVWARDELGHVRTYTYDQYRRCTSYTEPLNAPDWSGSGTVASRTWQWVYDRYFGTQGYDPSAHTSKQWRLQIEPAYDRSGNRNVTARWFDANDRVVVKYTGVIQGPGGMYNGPDIEVHSFGYDENGQKISYTDPLGRQTTYEYDKRNRLWKTNETVNTVPRTTETLYDLAGNKTMVKFPVEAAGQRTQQWLDYDEFGQPGRFIDERGNTTNLTYCWGPMKKLYKVTTYRLKDNGTDWEDQVTTFSYDLMGKPTDVEFPDHTHESTTYYCKVGLTSYLCDQPHSFTTRKGQQKIITYDDRGREVSHTWSDGTPGVSRTWDAASRLLTLSNSVAALEYDYDWAGQALYERTTVAGSSGAAQDDVPPLCRWENLGTDLSLWPGLRSGV